MRPWLIAASRLTDLDLVECPQMELTAADAAALATHPTLCRVKVSAGTPFAHALPDPLVLKTLSCACS